MSFAGAQLGVVCNYAVLHTNNVWLTPIRSSSA